jgi:hypothetical protein
VIPTGHLEVLPEAVAMVEAEMMAGVAGLRVEATVRREKKVGEPAVVEGVMLGYVFSPFSQHQPQCPSARIITLDYSEMKLTTRAVVVDTAEVVVAVTTTALIAISPGIEVPTVPRSENLEAEEAPVTTVVKRDTCPESVLMSELNEGAAEVVAEPATIVARKDTCLGNVRMKGWNEVGVEEEVVTATTAVRLVIL